MKLKLILFALLSVFSVALFAQNGSVEGGAGVAAVNGDPDDNSDWDTNDESYNSQLLFDQRTQTLYTYNPNGPANDKYIARSLEAVVNTNTRLDNPRVLGGQLTFDIIDVTNGDNVVGTTTVDVSTIAPVQGLVAGGDIGITDNLDGTFTITFNETIAGLVAGAGISIVDDGNGNYTIANTAPNVNQTISVAQNGTDVTVALTDGGSYDIQAGPGITLTVVSGNVLVENEESATIEAKNPADAGVQGVTVGNWFLTSVDNTMGLPRGIKVKRY